MQAITPQMLKDDQYATLSFAVCGVLSNPFDNLGNLIINNFLNPSIDLTILQSQIRAVETTRNYLKRVLLS